LNVILESWKEQLFYSITRYLVQLGKEGEKKWNYFMAVSECKG